MTDPHKGYLIIHDISFEEACELVESIGLKKDAYWWPFEELQKLDNAAAFAILTHHFPPANEPVKVADKE